MTRLVTTATLLVALISWGQDTTPTPTPNAGTVPYPLKPKGGGKITPSGTGNGGRGGLTTSKNQGKSEHKTTSMDVKVEGKSISPTPGLK